MRRISNLNKAIAPFK